MDVVCERMHRL